MNVQVLDDRAQQRRRSEPCQRLAAQGKHQQNFDHPAVGREFFAAGHDGDPPANLSYCGSRVMSSGTALAFATMVSRLVNFRKAESIYQDSRWFQLSATILSRPSCGLGLSAEYL